MTAVALDAVALDVLDNLVEGCQVVGFDWTYVYVNEAVAAHGKRSRAELLGRTMMECYPGIESTPVFAALRETMQDRAPRRMESEFTFPDGSLGWFDLRIIAVPQGVCVLSIDATQRKRSELELAARSEQLRQAQKMEAIGSLAGGVAHDFNNLLSVILSYSKMLAGGLRADDPMRAELDEIHKAGIRATELTRQLLAFGRKQILDVRPVALDGVVAGIERMLRRLLGEDVELSVLAHPGSTTVCVDPGQVEQVLLNLAVNSRDAMPDGGKLTIETSTVLLDEEYVKTHLGVAVGHYVMLAVSDTGTGMDKATQARMFEPFFTTKGAGKGTGLGLATVFGIVKQSGGDIWVYSEPGKGTTFKVYFPRFAGPAEPTPSHAPPPPVEAGSGETILLVEDDEAVRVLVRNILRRAGYHVLEAQSGGDALLLCEQHDATIHLLLTDVIMPRMSGRQLADRLLKTRPEMRVLYMSGYTDNAIVHHGMLDSDVMFLQKPITPSALQTRVHEVLHAVRERSRKGTT